MTLSGRCHCGAIEYTLEGTAQHVAVCHCSDCRRNAGAPLVAWAAYPEKGLSVTKGTPKIFKSTGATQRSFCADCGTGLFYRNAEVLPGIVDVQSATLDDPNALPPAVQIQVAERIAWMKRVHELPEFERFPG